MNRTRDGGSTEALDRSRTRASIEEDDVRGTIVMFPLTLAVPAAEDVGMSDRGRGSASLQVERSWAGLGAITVMILAVVAYATVFGLFFLVGTFRGLASGQIDLTRTVVTAALLAPATAILQYLRRHRS
jgi:hypothetical protein